jgi:CBS domain-containing protein
MTRNVATVELDAMLPFVAEQLDTRRVSAVAVVDAKGAIVGVLSRTDLLRVGRIQAGSHRKAAVLTLPEQQAGELVAKIARTPIVVTSATPLREAAQQMCEHHVHRLFVVDDGKLAGVVSTLDMMNAVTDARVEAPITEIMSSPVFKVQAQQPIGLAVERLEQARVSGLVVVDEDDWPVGVFTQVEAMEARELPRDTKIEDVFDPSMLCLPVTTKIHRAAAQAGRLEVRWIIPCREREAVGIITGLDFAKLVAA